MGGRETRRLKWGERREAGGEKEGRGERGGGEGEKKKEDFLVVLDVSTRSFSEAAVTRQQCLLHLCGSMWLGVSTLPAQPWQPRLLEAVGQPTFCVSGKECK